MFFCIYTKKNSKKVFYYTAVRILAQQESHSKASRHKAWKQEIELRNGEVFPPTHPDDRGENIENARLLLSKKILEIVAIKVWNFESLQRKICKD